MSINDPCIPRQNAKVQVQNLSGYTLLCNIGAQQVSVPPQNAVTIDEGGGYLLQVNVLSTAATALGTFVLTWLQPGETSPVSDGPLNLTLPQQQDMTTNLSTSSAQINGGVINAYSLTIFYRISWSTPSTLTINGSDSNHVYAVINVPAGNQSTSVTITLNYALYPDVNFNITWPTGYYPSAVAAYELY
jgi:hypothetical protein